MFDTIFCHLPSLEPAVVESLIELAVEIAREGREGRRIGTLFTLGDHLSVLEHSRALILDPLAGHPKEKRALNHPDLRGTIKELAQLDGAFVVAASGLFEAACRYLNASAAGVEVPLGLGSRHIAGASISRLTDTVAIVVSESAVVRVFYHANLVAEIVPELWLLRRHSARIRGAIQERAGDVTVITNPVPAP
jgi:diadenylate cyclase